MLLIRFVCGTGLPCAGQLSVCHVSHLLSATCVNLSPPCVTLCRQQTDTFCRHPFNLNAICKRGVCPLANSRYATVREHDGELFLYMKTTERAHMLQFPLPQSLIFSLSSHAHTYRRAVSLHEDHRASAHAAVSFTFTHARYSHSYSF
ncbi:unnamed protein product [Closterium sp. NIES-54]